VIVLSHLPSLSVAQLQRALPPPHVVSNSVTWDELVARVHRWQHDVAVIDPCVGNEHLAVARLGRLRPVLALAPSAPVIAYVSVSVAAMRAVQALGQLVPHELIIRGVDDSPDALAAAVHRVVAAGAAIRLMACVATSLRELPPNMSAAIEAMFHRPERVRSVSELVATAHTTRRSFDRWLARAGLAPARTLLACARANAAFHILTVGRLPRRRAAALVGYSSARSLARELHALTGWSRSPKAAQFTKDEFATALGRRLARRSIQSAFGESSH